MKKAIGILIILTFFLFYYLGAFTKNEPLPFSKEFFSIETSSADRPLDLKEISVWISQGIGSKTSIQNTKPLDQIYQLKMEKGIRNLPILSFVLIREAKQAREREDSKQAVAFADYAIKFSPDLPQSYFEMAKARWHQNPFQFHQTLSEIFRGLVAQFRHYPSSLKFFYNLFYILSNAILMTFVVYGIVILVKYLPLYFYDIRRNLTKEISKIFINSIKIFALFIPFFLCLDLLWAILFWSILFWGFASRKEKRFVLVFFIILVYLPFFLRSSSSFLDDPSSSILLEMDKANQGYWDGGIKQKLEAWLSTHSDDAEVLFTLGLIEKREGHLDQAEKYYRRVVLEAPQFSEALSNLGNVYLAKKQMESAIASYQKAVDLNPNKGAYYYNLYRAYSQETYLSGKMDKAFERARHLDPKLVDQYSAIDSSHFHQLGIDEVLTAPRLWRRFLKQFIGREGALYLFFKAWFEEMTSRTYLVPVFFLGLWIMMSRFSRTKRFLTRCPMCGSPTYRLYLGALDQDLICFNCHRIFVKKEKLHPKITEKKSLQAHQFQKQTQFIGRFLSFFFVGFGDLWRGQIFRGLLFLFIFFIFILRFVYWNGVIHLYIIQSSPIFLKWVFWGGLFIVYYLLYLRRAFRFKPRFGI